MVQISSCTLADNSHGTFVTCAAFTPFARIQNVERKAGIMPLVTVNTGFTGPDGDEEQLTEYFCDSPNCPNIAVRAVRFASEIGECLLLCEKHAAKLRLKA